GKDFFSDYLWMQRRSDAPQPSILKPLTGGDEDTTTVDADEVRGDLADTGADASVLPDATPEQDGPTIREVANEGQIDGQMGMAGDGFDMELNEDFFQTQEVNQPKPKPTAPEPEPVIFDAAGVDKPVSPGERFQLDNVSGTSRTIGQQLLYAAERADAPDDKVALQYAAGLFDGRANPGKAGRDLARMQGKTINGV